MPLKAKSHSPLLGFLFPAVNIILYTAIFEGLQNNTGKLAQLYFYQKYLYDIAMLGEVAISTGILAIVTVMLRRFKIQRCFVAGCIICYTANLLSLGALHLPIYAFIIARFITGAAFGVSLSTGVAFVNFYVARNFELGVCLVNFIGPIGNTIAFLVFRYSPLQQVFHINLGISIFALILAIAAAFVVRPVQQVEKVSYSVLNVIILPLAHFLFGICGAALYGGAAEGQPRLRNLLLGLEAAGVVLSIIFYVINYYVARMSVIPREAFNQNTVKFLAQFSLVFVIRELLFNDYNELGSYDYLRSINRWQVQAKYIVVLPLPFLLGPLMKRYTVRRLSMGVTFLLGLCMLVNMLNITVLNNQWVYCFVNAAINGLVYANQSLFQYYNARHSVAALIITCGSYLYYDAKVAYVVAYCLSYAVEAAKVTFVQQQTIVYGICIAMLLACVALIHNIGVFPFEEGRKGYKSRRVADCKTFTELMVQQADKSVQHGWQQAGRRDTFVVASGAVPVFG